MTASIRREHLVDAEQLVVDQLGLAEARHPRPGVLEAEHQAALELALAAGQLLVVDAAPRRSWRARRARPAAPASSLRGQAAHRDPDQSGVDVLAGEGEDGVGQSALLADLLEEPARGATAERGVEHAEREAARVGPGQPVHAQDDVDLLELAGGLDDAGADAARLRDLATDDRLGGPVEEAVAAEGLAHPAHASPRGRRCRRRPRPCARGGSDACRSGRPASRVIASIDSTVPAIGRPSGESPQAWRGEQVVRDVVGVVVVHRDLVEDHVTLGLDVVGA